MTDEQVTEFSQKLDALTTEYGIKYAAFCGSTDDAYIGLIVGGSLVVDLWQVALNVGRLWQHVREQTRTTLNQFDAWSERATQRRKLGD